MQSWYILLFVSCWIGITLAGCSSSEEMAPVTPQPLSEPVVTTPPEPATLPQPDIPASEKQPGIIIIGPIEPQLDAATLQAMKEREKNPPTDPEWVCTPSVLSDGKPQVNYTTYWQPVPSVIKWQPRPIEPSGSSLSTQAPVTTPSKVPTTSQPTSSSAEDNAIRILYWGAMDGSILPTETNDVSQAPFAYLAALIATHRTPNTIVCSTGDLFSGEEQNDRPIMKALELVGLEFMALSNLELNYGVGKIKDKLSKAKFVTLSANVYEDKTRVFTAYSVKNIAGAKVAIIGITTEEAAIQVAAEKIQGITFQDTIQEVQDCLHELKGKADIFILLSNLRHNRDIELAQACPQLHAIVGRYDVEPQHLVTQIGDVLITRVHHKLGAEIGELDIKKKNGTWIVQQPKIYFLLPPDTEVSSEDETLVYARDSLTPDPEALQFLQQSLDTQKELSEVLTQSEDKLEGEYKIIRQQETNLGNLIADIVLESGIQADIAVVNSGGIRASLPQGNITKGMLLTTIPYNNKIMQLEVSGETVREILENSVAQYEKVSGAFLQVAGMSFSFDPLQPKFSRVKTVTVQGDPLDPQKTYKLVTLGYLVNGGDDYVMLKDKPAKELPLQLQQLIEQYFRNHPHIQMSCENRIINLEKQ